MLLNYFKIAWRSLMSRRMYSFVNIAGLALGITAFAMILQYVSLEQSVNRFHAKLPQMYRVLCQNPDGKSWPQVEPGWAVKAMESFPEIRGYCRIAAGIVEGIVKNETTSQVFREADICYAEGNFFEFFSFPLVAGNAAALTQPDAVFIAQSCAAKYFGEEDPLGKPLMLYNQFGTHRYMVQGVFEDMRENSSLQYDMVFSLETLRTAAAESDNDWANLDNLDNQFTSMFLLLDERVNMVELERKMTDMRRRIQPEKDAVVFRLQAFGESHLAADFNDDLYHTGNVRYVYMLMGIGGLILLIAWFNYINLSTAQALRRGKEVGVRKSIGASKSTLIAQFLSETMLVNVLALCLAGVLIVLLQPVFNALIGKQLSILTLFSTQVWLWGLATMLIGALLTGAFTANAMAGFNPAEALRGRFEKIGGGLRLRQILVVLQFAISTALILFTVLIYSQLNYMQNKNLGMNTDQLMIIRGPEVGRDSTYGARKTVFWNELAAQSFVTDYCTSATVPGEGFNFTNAGLISPKSKPGAETQSYSFAIVNERFLGVYDLSLAAGRNFSAAECQVEWNDNSKILVNEKALTYLGLTLGEALTTKIQWDERYLDIVGVVKDYHHSSLQQPIEPIIYYPQNNSGYFTIRLTPNELPGKIAALEQLYGQYFSGNPFEYFFADDNFQKAYLGEQQYSWIFSVAALWAIFIACLGLFGLVSFTIESKVKEIGIRKVLGASIASITGLLAKDFLKLVLIAIVIASPVAYYFMQKWLSDFAYRIEISWWMFAAAGGLALVIAFLTVGAQSVKAALANPVKSLRSE